MRRTASAITYLPAERDSQKKVEVSFPFGEPKLLNSPGREGLQVSGRGSLVTLGAIKSAQGGGFRKKTRNGFRVERSKLRKSPSKGECKKGVCAQKSERLEQELHGDRSSPIPFRTKRWLLEQKGNGATNEEGCPAMRKIALSKRAKKKAEAQRTQKNWCNWDTTRGKDTGVARQKQRVLNLGVFRQFTV